MINRKHRSVPVLPERVGAENVRDRDKYSDGPNLHPYSFRLDRAANPGKQRSGSHCHSVAISHLESVQLRPVPHGKKLLPQPRRHQVNPGTVPLHQLLLLRPRVPVKKQRFVRSLSHRFLNPTISPKHLQTH